MSLPNSRMIVMEVKWYLASYRVCKDCIFAIEELKSRSIGFVSWRVQWAGICTLLKTAIHLLRNHDTYSCLPDDLKAACRRAWTELRENRDQYPLFWEFIDRERNNIIKEYSFSAYTGIIREDGSIDANFSALTMLTEQPQLFIKGGKYDGRAALDVALEAANWVESFIFQIVRSAGYDPDATVRASGFLKPDFPKIEEEQV